MERMIKLNEHLNESAHKKIDEIGARSTNANLKRDTLKPKEKFPPRVKHIDRPQKKTDKELGHTTVDGIRNEAEIRQGYEPDKSESQRKALYSIKQQANQKTKVKVGSETPKIKLGEDQEDLERAIENDQLKASKRVRLRPNRAKTPKVDMKKANAQRKANVSRGNSGGGGIYEDSGTNGKAADQGYQGPYGEQTPKQKKASDKANQRLRVRLDAERAANKPVKEARSHGGEMTTIKMKDGRDHGVQTRNNTVFKGETGKATYVGKDGRIRVADDNDKFTQEGFVNKGDNVKKPKAIDEFDPHLAVGIAAGVGAVHHVAKKFTQRAQRKQDERNKVGFGKKNTSTPGDAKRAIKGEGYPDWSDGAHQDVDEGIINHLKNVKNITKDNK
jgi:hypothetical protein